MKPFIEITEEDAISLYDAKFWVGMSYRDRAEFQLYAKRLCMPFNVFHEAVEKTLGRSVWTHEFGLNYDGIVAELRGEKEPPTFAEIVELIPEEKRVLLVIDDA